VKTKKPTPKAHPVPPVTEHPNTTLADLRQKWLFQSREAAPPEDFPEFIAKSLSILHEWHHRWSEVWRLVNPKAFRTEAEKEHFLRENELKAYGLWHAMRELRVFWREAGVWDGNPFDVDDVGEVPRAGKPNDERGRLVVTEALLAREAEGVQKALATIDSLRAQLTAAEKQNAELEKAFSEEVDRRRAAEKALKDTDDRRYRNGVEDGRVAAEAERDAALARAKKAEDALAWAETTPASEVASEVMAARENVAGTAALLQAAEALAAQRGAALEEARPWLGAYRTKLAREGSNKEADCAAAYEVVSAALADYIGSKS
jgi:hypothetical protein